MQSEKRKKEDDLLARIESLTSGHELQRSPEQQGSMLVEPIGSSDPIIRAVDAIMITPDGERVPVDFTMRFDHGECECGCILMCAETDFGRELDADHDLGRALRRLGPFHYHMHYDVQGRPCTFGRWVELSELRGTENSQDLQVAYDTIGRVTVSTVWTGINLSYGGGPEIFETMVFGGEYDLCQMRYATREQATLGHAWIVAVVRRDAPGDVRSPGSR